MTIPFTLDSEHTDFRAVVEPPIAGMAALRATKADLIRLEEACMRMDSEHNARAFAELDRVFHYRIAEACHNRLCVNPRHLRWATREENGGGDGNNVAAAGPRSCQRTSQYKKGEESGRSPNIRK